MAHTQVLPCLCRLRSGVCFPPRQDGADAEAYWTHSLSWAGKREGYGRCKWNVRGGPGAVKAFGVAAARGRSSTLSGELALGHGNLGNAKVHELLEGVGYDLCLLAASCTCDPWGWACGATHPLPVALPLALTAAGRCACLWDCRPEPWLVLPLALMPTFPVAGRRVHLWGCRPEPWLVLPLALTLALLAANQNPSGVADSSCSQSHRRHSRRTLTCPNICEHAEVEAMTYRPSGSPRLFPQLCRMSPLWVSSWQSIPVLSLGSDPWTPRLSTQPPSPWWATVQSSISGWETLVSADFCVEISLLCLPHTCCCALLWASKDPPVPACEVVSQ